MPVFRVEKNENYTPISNIPLKDMTLSLRGKGLLAVVLSLPDEWKFSIKGLTSICREGRDGITSALNELQRNGYLIRKQSRQPNGTMGSVEYCFYESPQLCQEKPLPDMSEPVAPGTAEAKPDPVAPEPEMPDPVSPALLNTKGLSTKESNTEGEGKTPPHRKRYGRYRNVQLSDADLIQLKEEFPGTGSRGLRDCPSIWLPAVRATAITWQPFAAGPEGMPPSRSREPTVMKTIDLKEMKACDHSGHRAARPFKPERAARR